MFLEAARRLGVLPARAVVFEDQRLASRQLAPAVSALSSGSDMACMQ